MTDTVIHDRKPPWTREVDTINPQSKTIKDRPLETKITPPVTLQEVISDIWAVVKEDKILTNEKLKKLSVANARTRITEQKAGVNEKVLSLVQ